MKVVAAISVFALLSFSSCNSNSSKSDSKGKPSEKEIASVADVYFDNLFYTEPLNQQEFQGRKRELIKLGLITWLLNSDEKEARQCQRLLKLHSNREDVRNYSIELRNATKEASIKNGSTYIINKNRTLLFMISCESHKIKAFFTSEAPESIDEFTDFIFGPHV